MPTQRRRSFLRDNGLSLVLAGFFILFMTGQTIAGWKDENHQRGRDHQSPLSLTEYVTSGAFVEATAENFESEFLQAFAYVWLTAHLFQRGSAESKDPEKDEDVDRKPDPNRPDAPRILRRGRFAVWIYERSLGFAFFALFVASFVAHLLGGTADHNDEALSHGEPTLSVFEYLGNAQFWFQSFQNWQSEFLALLLMVVFTVRLRQRGSAESKPVDAPHAQTG